MDRVALSLVDSGLVAVSSRGTVSEPSPGLALVERNVVLVGQEAERNARLKPRRINSRFWQNPSAQALGRPFPHHLRAADLVHAHLSDFWSSLDTRPAEAILVVPGLWSSDQIALLLGIAEAASIPVRGLVDVAVAATADRATRRRCLHLDLHLHRAVLTELEHHREVVRGRVWEYNRIGLSGLRDLWARSIAQAFVAKTRFDPLHLAVTEQLLYVRLSHYIEVLGSSESTTITIASGGRQHSLEAQRRDLLVATQGVVDDLSTWVRKYVVEDETTILAGSTMAAVPGLLEELAAGGCEVVALHPAAAGSTALNHADHILSRETALPLVTRLPGYEAKPPGPITVAVTPPPGAGADIVPPTHLVLDGVAQPIADEPITIAPGPGAETGPAGSILIRRRGAQVILESPAGTPVEVNGQSVESTVALAAGDRIIVGDPPREILVVTMAS